MPNAGVGAVGKADDFAAQPLYGGFKRQPGAGGGFKKAAGDDFVLEQVGARFALELLGGGNHGFQVVPGEVGNGNHMSLVQGIAHLGILESRAKKSPCGRGAFRGGRNARRADGAGCMATDSGRWLSPLYLCRRR